MQRALYLKSQGFSWKVRQREHGEKEMRWCWTLTATLLSLAKHMDRRCELRDVQLIVEANRSRPYGKAKGKIMNDEVKAMLASANGRLAPSR